MKAHWALALVMVGGCSSEKSGKADAPPPEKVSAPAQKPEPTQAAAPIDAAPTIDAAVVETTDAAPADASPRGARMESPPSDAVMEAAIENVAMLQVLTGSESGAYDKLDIQDQGAELAKSISTAKGRVVATTPDTDTKVKSRIALNIDDLTETSLEVDAVSRRLRSRYLTSLKRCHETLLRTSRGAGGKVDVRFTVDARGKVSTSKTQGFNPELDTCVQQLVRRWRFATPKDGGGNPTTATFELAILFKAGS